MSSRPFCYHMAMSWLFEDPLPIIVGGLALAVVVAIATIQFGLKTRILSVLGVVALMLLVLLVERLYVTDLESIETTIRSAAESLQQNDSRAVLAHISPSAPTLRRDVESIMRQFVIEKARIGSNLKIAINQLTSPPSATAKFTGRVDARYRDSGVSARPLIRKFTIRLARQGDRWLVSEFEAKD